MKGIIFSVSIIIFFSSCSKKKPADVIFYNGIVYTVDSAFTTSSAFAVKDGRILDIGSDEFIKQNYSSDSNTNLNGKFVYPGFIDAHCHFYGYSGDLYKCQLTGTKSFDEILEKIKAYEKTNENPWIYGRGWDQNDWEVKEYPDNKELDKLFPSKPVFMKRVDGHAALINSKCFEVASEVLAPLMNTEYVQKKNGKPTGILFDNAKDAVEKLIPPPTTEVMIRDIVRAQENCLALGLTTLDDAGLGRKEISLLDSLQKSEILKLRIYAMVSATGENLEYYLKSGPYKTDHMNVCAFKIYADGALGSRGALLKQPYADADHGKGFLLNDAKWFEETYGRIYNSPFQACTHAIGDSANKFVLDLYGKFLKTKNDRRWRIEHAQVVDTEDIALFGEFSIIPSVQPTHATSDMYWAEDRLGKSRMKGAYAYKDLLKQNGWIPLGTDFPVEYLEPMFTFYAAVGRQDNKGFPPGGFQMENALSREEALRGMTIWAAKSNFEEREKGSLEKNKFADFVVMDVDLMKDDLKKIREAKAVSTYIGGVKEYSVIE